MASNPPLLSEYLTQTQRILHDSTGKYWTAGELTDYINLARLKTVADTGCNRILQTVTLSQGTETYNYSVLPQGISTIDVLNLTLLWGSLRVPMTYMPFTKFNLEMRAWQQFQSRPIAFSVYGNNTVYVGPVPDQIYTSEWDTVVSPANLVNLTDQCVITFPYSEAVPFYAAYMAKFKEQSLEEADSYLQRYVMHIKMALRSSFTRRITQPFNI